MSNNEETTVQPEDEDVSGYSLSLGIVPGIDPPEIFPDTGGVGGIKDSGEAGTLPPVPVKEDPPTMPPLGK